MANTCSRSHDNVSERHVYLWTIVSVNYHYKTNTAQCVDLEQSSSSHHMFNCSCHHRQLSRSRIHIVDSKDTLLETSACARYSLQIASLIFFMLCNLSKAQSN